jgi:predicted DNA-binding transcriptional regulator AlpA
MAKQYLKIEQVVQLTGLSQQTIYRRSRLKTFPSPEKVEGQKGGKQWVKTDVTKWLKANTSKRYRQLIAKPEVVKLEPKEQGKAEADDAQVLGIMKDETVIRPAFHKRLMDYIMKWFKR